MKWKTWLLPVVSTLLLLGLIWLAFSGGALRLSNVSGDSTRWDSGWYAAAGGDAVRAVALPARLRAGENDLVKTLPRVLPLGACVYIKCNNQQITAEADGRPLTVVGVGSYPIFGAAGCGCVPTGTIWPTTACTGKTVTNWICG